MEYVEDAEDVYEAERILRRVRSGRERTFTLDAVSREGSSAGAKGRP